MTAYLPRTLRDLHFPPVWEFKKPSNDNPETKRLDPSELVGPSRYSYGGFVAVGKYSDGNTAIMVFSIETGLIEYKASINIPEAFYKANHKYIWLNGEGDNEGVPLAFARAGFVRLTGIKHYFPDGTIAELAYMKPKLQRLIGEAGKSKIYH